MTQSNEREELISELKRFSLQIVGIMYIGTVEGNIADFILANYVKKDQVQKAVLSEREECAKVAEMHPLSCMCGDMTNPKHCGEAIAEYIRSRKG